MGMYDDLEPAFVPSPADALPVVARRARALRWQRRLLMTGTAAVALTVAMTSVAFATGAPQHHPASVAVAPEVTTSSSSTPRRAARIVPAIVVTTTTTADAPGTPAAPPARTIAPPTVPTNSEYDTSALEVSVSAPSVNVLQGNTATVNVIVYNRGTWAALPGSPPCSSIYVDAPEDSEHPPLCQRPADMPPALAPGASLTYPVEIRTWNPARQDLAISPGDYNVTIPYLRNVTVRVTAEPSTTGRATLLTPTVKFGDEIVIEQSATNASDHDADRLEPFNLVAMSGQHPAPAIPGGTLRVPAHASRTVRRMFATSYLAPGDYTLRADGLSTVVHIVA